MLNLNFPISSSFKHNQFGEIRTLIDDNGNPWFVAKEVANVLGYKDVINAVKQHCRWVVKHHLPHPQSVSKTIEVNIIPESDVYRLIIRSKLPAAERFEQWVVEEVLPSIRKHGMYRKEIAAESEELTVKSFIEHDGSFWLSLDVITTELERIGFVEADDEIQTIFEGRLDDHLSTYFKMINGKGHVREYGVNYALMALALETLQQVDKEKLYELCKRIEGALDALKGKDLTHVKIAAVRAYQEVVSRLNASGRDINFVRSLIRYKEKDLNVDEISVLTGQSRNDVAVYMEELDSSGIMEMADLLTAVPETLPVSTAQKSLPAVAMFANPTQEMIDKLGYNEAVVLHQLQVMIQESGKKRVLITYADWLKRFLLNSNSCH
jgi:prophage antirepressor-like protein